MGSQDSMVGEIHYKDTGELGTLPRNKGRSTTLVKTFTEEIARDSVSKSAFTQRIIDGKRCHLWLSTHNKEEAAAEYKYLQEQHKGHDWQTQKMTSAVEIDGKVTYFVWTCYK
jgi:hypothetical protein